MRARFINMLQPDWWNMVLFDFKGEVLGLFKKQRAAA